MVTSPMISSVCYIRGHFGALLLGILPLLFSALPDSSNDLPPHQKLQKIQFNKKYIPAIGSDKAL
ncbi:MAG: hypothetical protein WCA07_10060 [Gloeobacterales cyanobacterium]